MKKPLKIHTIGYQKRALGDFLYTLQRHGIVAIADIREKPYSRVKGYSRKNLAAILAENGIEYRHFQSLGSTQPMRDKIKAGGSYAHFFIEYKTHLANQDESLTELAALAESKPTCLLCFERDHGICHRKIVAARLAEMFGETGCEIAHL